METRSSLKVGRPLKGLKKRVRTSFTMDPAFLFQLEMAAKRRKKTKSEMLDLIIQESYLLKENPTDHHLQSKIHIPLPHQKIEEFCKKNHIQKLSFFGSVLTDQFNEESDVDVMVEFGSHFKPSLFDMVKMENELSLILNNKKIDFKTSKELSRYFRNDIFQNAEVVYVH